MGLGYGLNWGTSNSLGLILPVWGGLAITFVVARPGKMPAYVRMARFGCAGWLRLFGPDYYLAVGYVLVV